MSPKDGESTRSKSTPSPLSLRRTGSLRTVRYEETIPAKPPIPVIIAPPRSPPVDTHPAFRRPVDGAEEQDPSKRDSGLAPTESTAAREGSLVAGDEGSFSAITNNSLAHSNDPSSPERPGSSSLGKRNSSDTASKWRRSSSKTEASPKTSQSGEDKSIRSAEEFSPLEMPIPADTQLGLDFMDQVTFSKRGSLLLQGKRVGGGQSPKDFTQRPACDSTTDGPNSKILSKELEQESQKVRLMYEIGLPTDWENGRLSPIGDDDTLDEDVVTKLPEVLNVNRDLLAVSDSPRPGSALTAKRASSVKLEHELAGGIEDWEDIGGGDVDRYGFITVRKDTTDGDCAPEPRSLPRASTALLVASQTPRQKRGLGRALSTSRSSRTALRRNSSRKVSKSIKTQETSGSRRSLNRSRPFRSATNRLPGNRDRRWMDEAGDMLTLPPGLADIAEEEDGGRAAQGARKKEWDRAEKWRKMAKVVRSGKDGEGMEFEFDIRHPKLVERTWKGIPDRWRSAAWHSFLSTSAKTREGSPTDIQIVEDFHSLLPMSSADDVQIDMDVPRTINSHIMFRRRYRGGQRLLFRVLHALSLYFPKTGYVQGMASLAATLLCYFDEEKAFIMLVRMWQLRGLDKLYEDGFPGLMAAFDEFQKEWMDGHDVSKKLHELGIDPTAYGTRWYLTLFNYSIPFAAQLRVWDVFMLLGDADQSSPPSQERPFSGGMDVLHAASAALIDGTRDILLDSDFENAMKALTSWIPVKDEDLFMKVAKAEWKLHHGKRWGRAS